MGKADPTIKRPSSVSTVPTGEAQRTTASTTVPAGKTRTFVVTTFPESDRLSLWNFLWNIYIDTDDPNYDIFGGGALTDAILGSVIVADNLNWGDSSDRDNRRVQKIKVINNDSVDHVAYLKYKAYMLVGQGSS